MKKLTLNSLALVLIVISSTQIALATNITDVTIYPTTPGQNNQQWIIESVRPGTTLTKSLTIENRSTTTQTIEIDFHEAEVTKTPSTNSSRTKEIKPTKTNEKFTPKLKEPYKNIGNWITIPEQKITLEANQKKQIDVSIKVPEQAEEQEYIGAFYATTHGNQNNLKVVKKVGVRTYLTVDNHATNPLQTNIFNQIHPINIGLIIISLIGGIASITYYKSTQKHE